MVKLQENDDLKIFPNRSNTEKIIPSVKLLSKVRSFLKMSTSFKPITLLQCNLKYTSYCISNYDKTCNLTSY